MARSRGYRLIVTHHPCIFPKNRGLARVTPDSLVFEALLHGIAVVACHTNFDQCALEVVRQIADGLGIEPQGRLLEQPSGSLLKLSVFVTTSDVWLTPPKIRVNDWAASSPDPS